MNKVNTIKLQVYAEITELLKDKSLSVTEDTPLIGNGSLLDSMKLVELCVVLEDKASEIGFEFDWTSEAAMSRSRSMFRTAGSLASEFVNQKESQK
jgi:acyl carrier protein